MFSCLFYACRYNILPGCNEERKQNNPRIKSWIPGKNYTALETSNSPLAATTWICFLCPRKLFCEDCCCMLRCFQAFGTFALISATFCSIASAYLLIRREWMLHGCCDSKTVSKYAYNYEESYCHYPSLTFYGTPPEADSDRRAVEPPPLPIRMTPSQPKTSNVSSFFFIPTRTVGGQYTRSAFDQTEQLVQEEDV